MCGILVFKDSCSNDFSNKAIEIIKQRGPDQFNQITIDGYIFCHSRLIVSGNEKDGFQPVINNDYVFLFNGEIYNLEYLKILIGRSDLVSDTAILFEGFIKFGEGFFCGCDGPFSIVIYNRNSKEFLFFRDHLGEKPLFYLNSERSYIISSDLRVFLGLEEAELDDNSVSEFVENGYCVKENTIFKNIFRVSPIIPSGFFFESYESYVKSFCLNSLSERLELLSKNINYNNSAILLSSGVDSSVVAVYLSSFSNIKAYSLKIINDSYNDETKKARKTAKKLKIPFEIISIDNVYNENTVKETISCLSEPVGDPGIFNQYECIKKISKNHKVVFVGTGGDEIFCGYERYRFGFLISLISMLPIKTRNFILQLLLKIVKSPLVKERLRKLLGFSKITDIVDDRSSYLPNQLFSSFDSITFINGVEARAPFTSLVLRDFWVQNKIKYVLHYIILKYPLKIILLKFGINTFFKKKKGFTNDYKKFFNAQEFIDNQEVKNLTEVQKIRMYIIKQWLKQNGYRKNL
jgi:asparagine synthase (glutamine-hydrolysing)